MKKFAAWLMVAALCLSLFAACDKKEPSLQETIQMNCSPLLHRRLRLRKTPKARKRWK